MAIVLLLLQQNCIMLLYLGIGYLLFKRKLISLQGTADLGRVLLYVIIPVTIVKSYLTTFSMDKLIGLGFSFVAALLSLVLAMLVSKLFFQNKSPVTQFGTAFSNAGFIGIPLVQVVLGDEAVFYIASFVALLNILQWTYGVYLLTKDKKAIALKKLTTNPIVISFGIGLLLFLLPLQLPALLVTVLNSLSGMNAPLAMLILGTYLAQLSLKELLLDPMSYRCAAIRLLVIPVLTLFCLFIIPKDYLTVRLTILIAASAPVGSNVAIFSQLFKQDYTRAVKDICITTILCILTLPLIITLALQLYT